MSLVPLIFSDWWEDLDRPHRIFEQDFGQGLSPDQLLNPTMLRNLVFLPQPQERYSSVNNPLLYWRNQAGRSAKSGETGTSTVKHDNNQFKVILDVQQFKPDEINVKVVDKHVIVEAKHEEKKDEHGWISRQFVRKYFIPEQCDVDKVASSLSSDGILSITAPRKDIPKLDNARNINIEHTGKPAIQEKAPAKKNEEIAQSKKN